MREKVNYWYLLRAPLKHDPVPVVVFTAQLFHQPETQTDVSIWLDKQSGQLYSLSEELYSVQKGFNNFHNFVEEEKTVCVFLVFNRRIVILFQLTAWMLHVPLYNFWLCFLLLIYNCCFVPVDNATNDMTWLQNSPIRQEIIQSDILKCQQKNYSFVIYF